MCNAHRRLLREWHIVERVVTMVVEPFPWDEVESFGAALQTERFRLHLQKDSTYIDALSRMVCEYRCKDKSYERASVSLYPIQRAEEILGATMTGGDQIVSRFYNLTQL